MAVNFSFPFSIKESTHQIQQADEKKRVQDAVRCILMIHVKERWMRPDFGSRVQDYVFEQMDSTVQEMLRREIIDSLMRWGHGIKELEVEFHMEDERLYLYVSYTNEDEQTDTVSLDLEMR